MLLGIALKVLSAFVFTMMAALVRVLGPEVPVGQIVFGRSFFALAPLLLWLWWQGELGSAVRTSNPLGHLLRGTLGVTSMFLGFAALTRLPLPDATALGYAAPLLTVVLAALMLGERVRLYRWSAVLIGFCGVLVILWPRLTDGAVMAAITGAGGSADETTVGVLFALVAALFTAATMIQVRVLTQTERTGVIVFMFSSLSALVGLATFPFGWAEFNPRTWAILAAAGVFGGIGQILLTSCYRYADASVIAPFDYTTMIWALLIGYLFLSELPSAATLVGGAIVVGSGLLVVFRERQLGLKRARARKAMPPPPAA